MKNIQVIDGAVNASYTIYSVCDDDFAAMFPGVMDIGFIDEFLARYEKIAASELLLRLWEGASDRRFAVGVHGTLVYGLFEKRAYFRSKMSTDASSIESTVYRWWRKRTQIASKDSGSFRHVQIFDDRPEADYPVVAVTLAEFELVFPNGADMEFEGALITRLGWTKAHSLLHRIYGRRVHKATVVGLHGSLFRGDDRRKRWFPTKKSSEMRSYMDLKSDDDAQ